MTGQSGYGKMSLRDARKLYMHIEKEEILKGYSFPSKPGKDGYYRLYVPDPSKKAGRKQLFAKSLSELKDKVYKHEKGLLGHARKSFHDVYEAVLCEKLKYVKNAEKKLSRQNTINKNRSDYKRFFDGTEFEHKFIDEINKADIEGIVLYNLQRYDLREKALKSMTGILRSAFALAYEQYWVDDNVYSRVSLKKFKDMVAKEVEIDKRVHSDDEVKLILDEIHRHQRKKPYYIPAYALEMQILTGTRRGEIPPLRKTDVHEKYIEFSREQITVKKFGDTSEYFEIVDHTKTYRNRFFPCSDILREFLERLSAVHEKYYPDSIYLFPADNANGVITNNTVYGYYRRICNKLGIKLCRDEIKGTHSFRRNAITDVVNASGGNLVLAAKLFGNSPAVACKNYYTGINENDALAALNRRRLS